MKIAMIAPPWIPIPPPRYGGIESVVALLTETLLDMNHDVTLFCSPGSSSRANMVSPLDHAYPNKIGNAMYEVDHILQTHEYIAECLGFNSSFDIIHDHTSTGVAYAKYAVRPVLHTMHNGHAGDRGAFYIRHGGDAHLVAISNAQMKTAPRGLTPCGVVPNPIDVNAWPFKDKKSNYALWIGRFVPEKGAHRAIRATKIAGMNLILAGPKREGEAGDYFDDKIKPHIDDKTVRYVGEVGGKRKKNLFANAKVLLMPIEWNEPFGMVMVEALACGTPVVAFPYGAATEIVIDGFNGYQVADVPAMAEAMTDLNEISPTDCRQSVQERYSAATVARAYVDQYEKALE